MVHRLRLGGANTGGPTSSKRYGRLGIVTPTGVDLDARSHRRPASTEASQIPTIATTSIIRRIVIRGSRMAPSWQVPFIVQAFQVCGVFSSPIRPARQRGVAMDGAPDEAVARAKLVKGNHLTAAAA